MTCIIGLVHEGKVWMGGDSAASSGWDIRATTIKKVFRTNRLLIGYTSSFRMGQLLEHHLSLSPQRDEQTDINYLVTEFISVARKIFQDHGFMRIEDSQQEGGQFLVGYRGHLYRVDSDFQINQHTDGFDACGCGEPYALGAMMNLADLPPKERIQKALETAAHFSNGVRGPFHVEVLE